MTSTSKSMWTAATLAVAWVLVVGATMIVQPWFGLRRFGGVEYIPRVVALEVSRVWGAWGAAVVTCLLLTGMLHAQSASAPTPEPSHQRDESSERRMRAGTLAVLGALAVPVLYAPVSVLAFSGAMLLAWPWLGIPPRAFLEPIEAADIQRGLLCAIAFGLIPAAWSLFGRRVWGARRTLGCKLVVTYAVLFGVSVASRCAASLVES